MGKWLIAGVAVLVLLGRKSTPARSRLEQALQETASAGVNAVGALMADAMAGAGAVWDEATSATGAPMLSGGAKGAAVTQPRKSLLMVPRDYLGSVEPEPTDRTS